MRLKYLAIASISGCLLGMVVLILVALYMVGDIRASQSQVQDLLALERRVNVLSAASDDLLLYYPDTQLQETLVSEARAIQAEFEALDHDYPGSGKMRRYIDLMLDMLEMAHARPESLAGDGSEVGPLGIPDRSRIVMGQMAGHGMALDAAMVSLSQQRERDIARQTNRAVMVFAFATFLFGVLCILAFSVIHRRVAGPVENITGVIRQLGQGDARARVAVKGSDELAVMADSFNRLLDRQQQTQAELQRYEQDLEARARTLSGLLETRQILINSLPAHIALLGPTGEILDVNENWRQFARDNGLDHASYGVGENYLDICDRAARGGDSDAREVAAGLRGVLAGKRKSVTLEYPCHSPDTARWFRASINRLTVTDTQHAEKGVVIMHVDITERRTAEQELNRLAFEDPLTRVLSRNGFIRGLGVRLTDGDWDSRGMVVMLDLVNLRHVNDAHGYSVGDQLLQQLGARLSAAVGERGLVGRAGGDEFMVYLPSVEGQTSGQRRNQLAAVFDEPFQIGGIQIELVARLGYTRIQDRQRSIEQLLREAELALYQNTDRQGHRLWLAYTRRLDDQTRERIELAGELRRALERDEFELYFQPKVDMRTGHVVAAETLIRWHHPERGMVSPGVFIPVAEQSQLIGPIGDWVLATACRTLAEWQADKLDIVRVAVNISVDQFSSGDFTQRVQSLLNQFGVAPEALSLEITESVFGGEQEELLAQLNDLHENNIRLSLDDFGTGYSSLLYLQLYPFDEVKIDRGFVSKMLDNRYSHEIVKTVIGVAAMINAQVVAEGVETGAERDALLALGCHIGQGYYYSKPVPAAEFRAILEKRSALPVDDR